MSYKVSECGRYLDGEESHDFYDLRKWESIKELADDLNNLKEEKDKLEKENAELKQMQEHLKWKDEVRKENKRLRSALADFLEFYLKTPNASTSILVKHLKILDGLRKGEEDES